MHVVFVFDSNDRTRRVMWVNEGDSCVMARIMKDDGSVADEKVGCSGLHDAMRRYGGAYTPMYPAEVGDLRSAFKYLGKAADLVETLPEAHVRDIQPSSQAS